MKQVDEIEQDALVEQIELLEFDGAYKYLDESDYVRGIVENGDSLTISEL